MKNHFFISYVGNKRMEVEHIYNEIKDKITNIKTIVEPFCGSSAFSYYISTLHPNKYNYVLNDNNIHLISLYNLCKDDNKITKFINNVLELIDNLDKVKYNEIIKKDTVEAWYIKHKIYYISSGLFPKNYNSINSIKLIKKFKDCPIFKFIQTENIEFINVDAIELIPLYNNNETFLFLDPPYINSCNDFYKCPNMNIYEYLKEKKIENYNSTICLCLENMWIIKLIFKDNIIYNPYEKLYQLSKKKTSHILIINK